MEQLVKALVHKIFDLSEVAHHGDISRGVTVLYMMYFFRALSCMLDTIYFFRNDRGHVPRNQKRGKD